MFDPAHVGDTVRHCQRTFGLRPAEDWSEPTTVVSVETDYYGSTVTVEDGITLTSSINHMVVVRRAG